MNEREAFEEWIKKEHPHIYSGSLKDNEDSVRFKMDVDFMFIAWQASANREGYKFVPVEMAWQKADELASEEWDKNKSMFCVDNRDMSALQVEKFRLRWCKNKAYQIMSDYKAMIGAIE